MINLTDFVAKDSQVEYSVDMHFKTLDHSDKDVMYITITRVELDSEQDYTVILNGLPMPKTVKRICNKDASTAEFIINVVLKKVALEEVMNYWNFDKDEWEMNLDLVLKQYKESIGIDE